VAGFNDAITGFRHRTPSDVFVQRAVIGVKPGSTHPRAEFNVIVDQVIPIIIEGSETRISGNFIGVLPDGLTRVPNPTDGWEGHIEIGRQGWNTVIGTDGDGVNDAEERNLLSGGVHPWFGVYTTESVYSHIIEFYGGTRTNILIAGNYVGVGVDGRTFFTNVTRLINGLGNGSSVQIGSDFDGVSDDVEANVIANNHPFDVFFPDPYYGGVTPPDFAGLDAGECASLRGNVLINNNSPPFSYADNTGFKLEAFTNYCARYMDTNVPVVPMLNATSIYPRLKGTFAVGIAPYTNIIIDLYQADPEGWANGRRFNLLEMTDYWSYTNGFAQGLKYLGSRVVPNTGSFDLDVSGLDMGLSGLTVTVNYSADPPGTRRGRTHTSNFASPVTPLPGDVASVGLRHLVPDMPCWYSAAGYPTNGPVNPALQVGPLGNWEPYASVLGDSTFLIEFNTYASDGINQNNMVALQPAAGGAPKLVYAFWADAGTPFKDQINLSRQNGNPGRVAGDPRYGAVHYLTEAEASLGQLPAFQATARWANNPIYQGTARYACAQPFALDPLALVTAPSAKAWDYVYGPFVTSQVPADATQVSRTGGRPIGLDNGNFVVMCHDRTRYLNPGGDATTFSIIRPDGSVVKSATLAKGQDIWDNMCAYRGGFAIRVHDSLLFYDNAGVLVHSNEITGSSGLPFGTGRGDASRIAGDIRSPYVYLIGRTPESGNNVPVSLAIWDARTGNCVARATVSQRDPAVAATDRAMIAVDALNRFCAVWMARPTGDFLNYQTVARVGQFDGQNITFLTPEFFPFVNHDNDPAAIRGFITTTPTVAMTPRAICIAAKGSINSTNNPVGGPDTMSETTVYTVISHPAPAPPPQPQMTVSRSGNNAVISWLADAGLFTLQAASAVSPADWIDVSPQPPLQRVGTGDAADRYQMTVPISAGQVFYRLVRRW